MRFHSSIRFALCLGATLGFAKPEAKAEAEAEAEAQQYTNNAPFSGAVYIVSPNGQEITAQGTNWCPDGASVSCSDINQPSWCCPNSYTCASPPNSNGLIGCCPSGHSCDGSVNAGAVSTVTVQKVQETSVVYVHPQPEDTVVVANEPTQQVVQGGFCSTLTMDGPNLPTTREAECGTILIVNEGSDLRALGYSFGAFLILIHLAIARMFHWF